MAKYFLQMSEKFLHKDLETYLATKNNFCCYFSNIGHFRNSKTIMNELLKINCFKKIEELMNHKGKGILKCLLRIKKILYLSINQK